MSQPKIYTKTGDAGQTSLLMGKRVSKNNARIKVLGDLDELNAAIGVVVSHWPKNAKLKSLKINLKKQQNRIFDCGAQYACPNPSSWKKLPRIIVENDIADLETQIDNMQNDLQPLKNFILPGGSLASAFLHMARAICRRCERDAIDIIHKQKEDKILLMYLNRLSDYLFVSARYVNYQEKEIEPQWEK